VYSVVANYTRTSFLNIYWAKIEISQVVLRVVRLT